MNTWTEAYRRGYEACFAQPGNPYSEFQQEFHEFQRGQEAGQRQAQQDLSDDHDAIDREEALDGKTYYYDVQL